VCSGRRKNRFSTGDIKITDKTQKERKKEIQNKEK